MAADKYRERISRAMYINITTHRYAMADNSAILYRESRRDDDEDAIAETSVVKDSQREIGLERRAFTKFPPIRTYIDGYAGRR